MFLGEYQNSIDAKGRAIIPAKFREELGESFVITKGLETCLFIYPMSQWEKFQEKIADLPLTSKESRAFVRRFFAGAVECGLDKQGRVNIPQHLREHAKIDKELVTIGVNERIEIWAKDSWDSYCEDIDDDYEEILQGISGLGI